MREGTAKLYKHLKTQRLTIPTSVRQDSNYPFQKDGEMVKVIIVDCRTVILKKLG